MLVFLLMFFIIIQSIFIIYVKDSVVSILLLINIFLLTSLFYMIIGAEFLSIFLLIIYVGAISILFLFIIMLLNLRILEIYSSFIYYLPIAFLLGVIFIIEFFWIISFELNSVYISVIQADFINFIILKNNWNNIYFIALLLFNYYYVFIFLAALILLNAMIGVIALTLEFYSIKFFDVKVNQSIIYPRSNVNIPKLFQLKSKFNFWR